MLTEILNSLVGKKVTVFDSTTVKTDTLLFYQYGDDWFFQVDLHGERITFFPCHVVTITITEQATIIILKND